MHIYWPTTISETYSYDNDNNNEGDDADTASDPAYDDDSDDNGVIWMIWSNFQCHKHKLVASQGE
jgi:hypothetical protein